MITVDTDPRVAYLVRLADDNMVLAQRLGELVSWMPELEEDIAVANLALDHLGQARALYGHAATCEGSGHSEDDLAMLRDERSYRNAVLVEQPNGDFAHVMARQLFVDAYQVPLYEALTTSTDETLAGIAGKAAKEARYHLRHSSMWVIRLGDGTAESHERMQSAVNDLWRYTEDLFSPSAGEDELVAVGIAAGSVRDQFDATIAEVFATAGLELPADPYQRLGGREGLHSEHLGHLLTEMQWLYRAHPGVEW